MSGYDFVNFVIFIILY